MPREFGQRLNPSWDALRAKTIFGAASFDIANGGGGGAGLTNQIIVWHADGSPLGFFDPTEAGVTSALAVCASGDTLEIPSVNIPMNAGITLIAGMSLIGKGENSVLTFGGFNGTAITMAEFASIWNIGVELAGSGTDALGIDGRFTSVVIAPRFVHVSGGSSTNIGVKYGA